MILEILARNIAQRKKLDWLLPFKVFTFRYLGLKVK